MIRLRTARLVLMLLCSAGTTVACDQDPFGQTERTVAGRYSLNRWESGAYYLDDRDAPQSGSGAIDGVVKRLGWNRRWILAERSGLTGDDGWMVVDVANKRVAGPFPLEAIKKRPELASLVTYRADSAWDHLK